MSDHSPSHDQRYSPQQREHAEISDGENPSLSSNFSDRPPNQPAVTSRLENPTSVKTHSSVVPSIVEHQPLQLEVRISEEQQVEDLESEDTMPLTPIRQVSGTDRRRGGKRKKCGGYQWQRKMVAINKKWEILGKNLNLITFKASKMLEFSKHEENLKRLGLWEFTHIEFDTDLRKEIIGLVIAGYSPKDRCSFVYDCKIPVNRAALGRALKLPSKKSSDSDSEAWPSDFLLFLDEFASTLMLLHEDTWMMPNEVLGWIDLIKDRKPEKVDWAGLVWFMVEKELAQGTNLVDCYYASHLQHLIKCNKEELLREKPKEEEAEPVLVDGGDDDDATTDEKMECEVPEERQKLNNQEMTGIEGNVGMLPGQDVPCEAIGNKDASDTEMEVANDASNADNAEHVSDTPDNVKTREASSSLQSLGHVYDDSVDNREENVGDARNVEKAGHADTFKNVGDAEKADTMEHDALVSDYDEDADDNDKTGSTLHFVGGSTCASNVDSAADILSKEAMPERVMNLETCPGEEEEQWSLGGKSIGESFLHPCSMAKAGIGDKQLAQDQIQDHGNDDNIDNAQLHHFNVLQNCNPLEGIQPGNIMQAMEAQQMPFNSSNLFNQSSFDFLSSRPEDLMMPGSSTSMFGKGPKREFSHVSHSDLDLNHKRLKVDVGFNMCMDQMQEWLGKARIAYQEEQASQHANMQQFFVNELGHRERLIEELRSDMQELERSRQIEKMRLENELHVMTGLIDGYRRALKHTQKEFDEYRKLCPQADVAIYRDAGSGGVVKTVAELKREEQRRKEEEMMLRFILEEFMKNAEISWRSDMEKCVAVLQVQINGLDTLGKEVEQIQGSIARRKAAVKTEGHLHVLSNV